MFERKLWKKYFLFVRASSANSKFRLFFLASKFDACGDAGELFKDFSYFWNPRAGCIMIAIIIQRGWGKRRELEEEDTEKKDPMVGKP